MFLSNVCVRLQVPEYLMPLQGALKKKSPIIATSDYNRGKLLAMNPPTEK